MSAKENAINLYMVGIRDGRPREAVAAYTGDRYTQHSTGVADGRDGFVAFFEPFLEQNPVRDIRILRALQDGPHVFVHAHQSLNDGAALWTTMDFFDSDADGKIVEHWDVIAASAPLDAATPGAGVDGLSSVFDHDQTAANKALVRDYVETCLIRRELDEADAFVSADRYVDHSGRFRADWPGFAAAYAAPDCPLSHQELFMLVGEGNFVATLNRARWDGADICQADLFRVDAGRIVEHWAVAEPVPPRAEWANGGKF